MFEKVGTSQIDLDLRCLKIQIGMKIYLIGLQDLEQALRYRNRIEVFQIAKTPVPQKNVASKEATVQTEQAKQKKY